MGTDIKSLSAFYHAPRGRMAAWLLRQHMAQLWPLSSLRGLRVLGVGFPGPYLRCWLEPAAVCISLHPARLGPQSWPVTGPNLACTAEEDALPFPDRAFDRIVLVHGLETADHVRRLLRELWRILIEDGRLMVVAPNRHGVWAHIENTPFGEGQPYSIGQIDRLLAQALFRTEQRKTALFVPPFESRLLLRTAKFCERLGNDFLPRLGGVTVSDAVKDVYAALPLSMPARSRVVLIEPGYCANRQLCKRPTLPNVTPLN
ncbi:MAG: methyltransferase domain-containing protein [Acidocella sp.]|nr:methyltransferase domain-containing protein [Acidocella sp.]